MKVLFFDAARKTLELVVIAADSSNDELAVVLAINALIGSDCFETVPTPFAQHVMFVDEEGALRGSSQEPWLFRGEFGQTRLYGNAVVCIDDGKEIRDATVSPDDFSTCIECARAGITSTLLV